jgi:uroporphyrinogen-III synthase
LSDLSAINYDVLVFFSPSGVKSLLHNFPKFKQNNIKIASFGETTAKAVKDAGLRLDLQAPMPHAPSMTMALDQFIKEHNKNNK